MKWSKLKQMTEDRFADSVKGHVEIFSTRYANSSTGRGWITIDKEEIVDFSTMNSVKVHRRYYNETTDTTYATHPATKNDERTEGQIMEEGEFSRFDLHVCCWEFLSMTVEDGLKHPSAIVNSLAILDKRLGKRRLTEINDNDLHPLTKKLLDFRLLKDGLKK